MRCEMSVPADKFPKPPLRRFEDWGNFLYMGTGSWGPAVFGEDWLQVEGAADLRIILNVHVTFPG